MNAAQEQQALTILHDLKDMFIAMSEDERDEFTREFEDYLNTVCTCESKDEHESKE